jgi:NitT/TauT family transport system substrate-binding protein
MKKHYLWVTIALVIVFVAGACAGTPAPAPTDTPPAPTDTPAPAPTATEEPEEAPLPDLGTIRIGALGTGGSAPYFVAIEKGYFAELGLDVEFEGFRSGSLTIAPLSMGQLDVGGGEAMGVPLLNAIDQGLPIRVVVGTSRQTKKAYTHNIVVRKDLYDSGEVTKIEDLKGRKLAINKPQTIVEYVYYAMAKQGGYTLDDVELVAMPFPEVPTAIANQAVDAAYAGTTSLAKIEQLGIGVKLVSVVDLVDPYEQGQMYFGKRFLDPANREVAVRFLMGWLKAQRELIEDKRQSEEIANIVLKYTETPVKLWLNQPMSDSSPNGTINMDFAMDVQDFHIERGHVDYTEPLSADQIFDLSFIEEALERLGRAEE